MSIFEPKPVGTRVYVLGKGHGRIVGSSKNVCGVVIYTVQFDSGERCAVSAADLLDAIPPRRQPRLTLIRGGVL